MARRIRRNPIGTALLPGEADPSESRFNLRRRDVIDLWPRVHLGLKKLVSSGRVKYIDALPTGLILYGKEAFLSYELRTRLGKKAPSLYGVALTRFRSPKTYTSNAEAAIRLFLAYEKGDSSPRAVFKINKAIRMAERYL